MPQAPPLAINLSAAELKSADRLTHEVAEILAQYELPPSAIVFDICEMTVAGLNPLQEGRSMR